ncbi:MAG: peroxide stress protein YaaA [Rothia sp. (in: high G+C Gram-positive bacteria)]|uniref:YaaA family protein n=1 Tax=Rothia sp. (in: high G+C Gram-positive bacteria) TaxID=1885016 RepID=UPI0026DEC803|nr:peroxide stress protein YaaA [Rothia sp. (in: high G+C Gram-positive bacteria)]MDO5750937.1 peroxide stress protein YaaA [Rothia sp. (in: high G+C Gram-positive bacteria)]
MKILLPPSEGKTPAPASEVPVDLAELSLPELTEERETVLETLMRVSAQPNAMEQLKVGASLSAEVERNTHLLREPAQEAYKTYSGVLFEALDMPGMDTAQLQRAQESLLISSALWGTVTPLDRIPAYRLSMGVKLGELGDIAKFWKGALTPVLNELYGEELMIDCRSGVYAKTWVPTPARCVAVRVEKVFEDGSRKVVSHMAKHYRGLLAGFMVRNGASMLAELDTPEALTEFLTAAGWEVELQASTARKAAQLTVLVRE